MAYNFELRGNANIGKTSVAFLCSANNILDTCYTLLWSDSVYSKLMRKLGKYISATNNPYICTNPIDVANLIAVGNVPGSHNYELRKSVEQRFTSYDAKLSRLATSLIDVNNSNEHNVEKSDNNQVRLTPLCPIIEKLKSANSFIDTYAACSDAVEKPREITRSEWTQFCKAENFIYLNPKNQIASSSLYYNCDNFDDPCSPNVEIYSYFTVGTCFYESSIEPIFVVRYYKTNPSIHWPLLQLNLCNVSSLNETNWIKIDRVLFNNHSDFRGTGLLGIMAYEGFSSPPEGGCEVQSSEDKISVNISTEISDVLNDISTQQNEIKNNMTDKDKQIDISNISKKSSVKSLLSLARSFDDPNALLYRLKKRDSVSFSYLIHSLLQWSKNDQEFVQKFDLTNEDSYMYKLMSLDHLLIERLRYLAESSECNIHSYAYISESGNLAHKKLDLFDTLVAGLNIQVFVETLGPLWNKIVPGEAILSGGFTAAMLASLEKATMNYVFYSYINRGNREHDILASSSFLGYSTGAVLFTMDADRRYLLPRVLVSTRHDNRNRWRILMDYASCEVDLGKIKTRLNFVVRNTLPTDEAERMSFIFLYEPKKYWSVINGKSSHFLCAIPTQRMLSSSVTNISDDGVCNFDGYQLRERENWLGCNLEQTISDLISKGCIPMAEIKKGIAYDFGSIK